MLFDQKMMISAGAVFPMSGSGTMTLTFYGHLLGALIGLWCIMLTFFGRCINNNLIFLLFLTILT